MEKFQVAFQNVMTGKVTAQLGANDLPRRRSIDGVILPG
jgi:hypothetical protein